MSKRKFRTVISLASACTAIQAIPVHDRQATELPANAIVAVRVVDDPYQRGERISALASLRDDPLGRLHARDQIDDAQYLGGRRWQFHHERSQWSSSSEIRDPVDGGGHIADPLVRCKPHMLVVLECAARLGDAGNVLIHNVLGERMFLWQVAEARGLDAREGSRDLAYLGRRLNECLNTLAQHFHYA